MDAVSGLQAVGDGEEVTCARAERHGGLGDERELVEGEIAILRLRPPARDEAAGLAVLEDFGSTSMRKKGASGLA